MRAYTSRVLWQLIEGVIRVAHLGFSIADCVTAGVVAMWLGRARSYRCWWV